VSDSIRDALTAAYEAKDKEPATDDTASDDATINAEVVDSSELPADTMDETSAPDSTEGASEGESIPDKGEGATAAAVPAASEAAPASWTQDERAGWATAPEAVRKAVLRREGEMNRALQVSSSARKRVESLDKITQPYKPLLDSYGITVEQAMPGLLATRAALEVGTPAQKAELIANLCADFGIEVELLDGALATRYQGGRPAPRVAPVQMPDLATNPQLAPLFAMAEQVRQAQTERAQEAVSAVSADPHYNEVRFTMADLIEKAHVAGRKLDLPTALGIAKQLHGLGAPAPTATSVSDAARTLAAARNAASSVSGAPKPTSPRKPGEGSLRDELIANMSAKKRA
jgi:hypothetical protein